MLIGGAGIEQVAAYVLSASIVQGIGAWKMAEYRFLKYTRVILGILLMGSIVAGQDAAGFSKSSSSSASHRRYASADTHHSAPKLLLRSYSALVEDQQTGEFLVQKNANAVVPIASITKLMTAMVVLDAEMESQESLVIEREDVDTLRHSHSRLPVGTRISRKEALLLALMASENRAANTLSRSYPGGRDAFVTAMNAKARSLGLTETRFTDPAGLSSDNVSSARDLARMANAACKYPLIRDFTTREEAIIQAGRRKLTFRNTNQLIRSPRWQIGLSKTGFIDEAGRCLVMQAQVAQRPVLIILLDAQGRLTLFGDANRIKQWMEKTPSYRITRRG
jgi:serine-type D-Ala-D-Ala endopeptidase (penicillin-binding protein 7)